MKKLFLFVPAMMLASAAVAEENFLIERAGVLEKRPLVETRSVEVTTCDSTGSTRGQVRVDDTGDRILGGVVGGLAGAQIGKGSGSEAAAAIGALAGAEFADSDELTEEEIIGGIAGGLLGNQLGKGNGKKVTTAGGALAGSIIARNLMGNGQQQASARNCNRSFEDRKVIVGYEVDYEYRGQTFTGRLPYDPGEYVEISVEVDLLENATEARPTALPSGASPRAKVL